MNGAGGPQALEWTEVHFLGKAFYGLALILNSTLLVLAAFVPGRPTWLNTVVPWLHLFAHFIHLAVLPDSSLCAWWRLRVAYSSLAKLEWVSLQSQSWLQPRNAMCTSHFGAIVRTTHVTGTAGLSKRGDSA